MSVDQAAITAAALDAIVNTANQDLLGGGVVPSIERPLVKPHSQAPMAGGRVG